MHGEFRSSCGQKPIYLVAGQEGKKHGRDPCILAVAGTLHAQGSKAERLAGYALGDPDSLYAGERYGRLTTFEEAAFDVKEVSLARERETSVGEHRSCYRQEPGQEQRRGEEDQEHLLPVRLVGLDKAPEEFVREDVVEELESDGEHREGDADLAARRPGHQQFARREPPEYRWALGLFHPLSTGTFYLAPQRLGRRPVQRGERGVRFARSTTRRLDANLDHAEEALDDPLNSVHRLDVIQGYRPLTFLEYALTQPERVGRDGVGGGPPGEETPEGRESADYEDTDQEQDHRPQAEPLAHQEDYAGEDEPPDPAPERPYGSDEHGDRVEMPLRAHPAPPSVRRCGREPRRRQGSRARGSGSAQPRCKRRPWTARTGAATVPDGCLRAGCGPAARVCGRPTGFP